MNEFFTPPDSKNQKGTAMKGFRDTFGKEQVEYDSGIPKPHAFIFFTEHYLPFIGNEVLGGGLCNGMSVASLLFFENPSNIKNFNPDAQNTNQLDQTKELEHHIEVYQSYWLGSQIQNYAANQSNDPNILFDTIKNNPDQRYVISIYGDIKEKDKVRRAGHSLVPYEIQKEGDNAYAVYVYDCNYPYAPDKRWYEPGQEIRKIIFNRDNYSWKYTFDYNEEYITWKGNDKNQCASP